MDCRIRKMLVAVACFNCVVTGLSSIFSFPSRNDDDSFLENYSSYMTESMNRTADPCDDFYEYSCGNWNNSQFLGDIERNTTVIGHLQNITNNYVKRMLDNSTDDNLILPKIYYKQCIEYNEEQKAKDIDSILMKADRFVSDWKNLTFPGIEWLLGYTDISISYKSHVDLNRKLINFKFLDNFNYTRLQKNFGNSSYFNLTEEEFKEILEYEKSYEELDVKVMKLEKKYTITKFIDTYAMAKINWTDYFNTTTHGIFNNWTTIYTTVEDFSPILNFIRQSNPKVLFNYIKWGIVMRQYPFPSHWNTTDQKKWKSYCIHGAALNFKMLLSPMILKDVFDSQRRVDVLEIARNIQSTFYNMLNVYDWLENKTRSALKTNLKALDFFIGYSDDIIKSNLHKDFYSGVGITTNDSFLEIYEKLNTFTNEKRFKKIDWPLDIYRTSSKLEVNAFMDPHLYMVVILASFMQVPIYHYTMPPSLKYGSLGYVIGHEIIHAFDSNFIDYDYNGHHRTDLLSELSRLNFNERKSCIESQYNKYWIENFVNNGNQTLAENIADNGGIRIAYYAYLDLIKNDKNQINSDQRVLPNLYKKFTNRQLFFVQMAQAHCGGDTLDTIKKNYQYDAHAIGKFRVNGMLANMNEFSQVFSCPLGTNMNPLKKCILW